MNALKAPSLQSLLESDRGSNDSLLAESLQLEIEELDDAEYSIPAIDEIPTLESVLTDLDGDSDIISEVGMNMTATPTPSMDDTPKTGTIWRHIILQGVSAQISSATDRVGAGLPASVAISEMIAVGTSHGYILAFDSTQALRWCCKDHAMQGTVSTLAFNDDNSRLLAGFARGYVIMIDTSSGDTIRVMTDVITPNTGVLHIKWIQNSAHALCSDSGGSVWFLNFTRRLGIRGCESRCIFSGSRGEVCAVEPLVFGAMDHPLKDFCIAALATLSKFVVVTIRPRLKVIKFQPLTGPADCLPLLAWQMVLIQSADTTRVIDPVLATVRGNNLYFHQITYRSRRVSLLFLRNITLPYNLIALHWMGPKTIAALDAKEKLHLNDVRTNKELECIDIGSVGLVYSSAQFKAFATGGNVSPALALAGTYACYNTIISKGSQLYILGGRALHSISVRSWSDRITHLSSNQQWADACALAIEGYKAAGDRMHRKEMVKSRALQLVDEYIQLTSRCPEHCLDSIMNCLIEIQEFDVLWQELWERLTVTDAFLILLTEHIQNGSISFISPVVSQSLCDYWSHFNSDKLEDIILKLDWKCLDLHQVLTVCKKEKLFKAQIYLNSHALGDYTLSLTDLIPLILEEDRNLGNYLLVYVSSCLAGRGYPAGNLEEDMIPTVKHEVLRCLTSVHSNCAADTELSYPYLRQLLNFDTRETLNVLSLAFQEREFTGELGQSHRQRIVNILLEILTPENSNWSDIACLLNFISIQISSRSLPEDSNLLNKVLNYLRMGNIPNETPRQHVEREEAWLGLIESNCLLHIPTAEHLKMAQSAKCYRVIENLMEKRKTYNDILSCYICDPYRNSELWSYVKRHMDNPSRKIYEQLLEHFEKCVEINCEEITCIIIENFISNLNRFIRLLDRNEQSLYMFLDQLNKHQVAMDINDSETYLQLLCKYNTEKVEGFLKSNENYRIENALEIVKAFQLTSCSIFLYEKQGDFQSAFHLSMELLKEAPESTAESRALIVSSLCSRGSLVLPESEREKLWFTFLRLILPRPDLTQVSRVILHAATGHVNLTNLVQLVLTSGTSTGNFGDIKHILLGMLSNSKYETLLLQTTTKILGHDLHNLFAKEKRAASQGLFIKSIKCVVCRMRLHNQQDVIVLGSCNHVVHQNCIDEQFTVCPRCGATYTKKKPIRLAVPKNQLVERSENNLGSALNVKAPTRIGLSGR
ncbi:Vacuolar protein sorting-associated protein 8 like [Pseudolycoriella hygida]|uniref:Vacuolar protein sorting-associated protein 8 like n=1 Tax=Pseudolycoriella hygida TaxID=35572 RepID=A0A9Q0N3N1_9DIPT|nr:Vacuolar protein sorting-associated protein 8 like [Pseudolycoriella hygida]